MSTTEAVKPSHLSPYKSGSPSSITKDVESTNIQATCYNKFTNSLSHIGVLSQLLQQQFNSSGSNIVLNDINNSLDT